MTKHTPGQWMKKYDGPSLPIITADNPNDPPFTVVALIRTDEADANLIAAAPELLEALQGVLLSENDTHRQSDDRWSVFRQAARAAIAKATGQESLPLTEAKNA